MNFEEKMDAMRMNLELASHDIEGLRVSIQELRASIQEQHANMQGLHANMQELHANMQGLHAASASQHENIQVLMKVSENLLATSQSHEHRISGLERRA